MYVYEWCLISLIQLVLDSLGCWPWRNTDNIVMRWRMWLWYKTNLHNSLSCTLLQNKTVAKRKQEETNAKCLAQDKMGKINYVWLGVGDYFKWEPKTGSGKVYIYTIRVPRWHRHCAGQRWANAAFCSTNLLLKNDIPSSGSTYSLLVTNTRPISELWLVGTSFRCAQSPPEGHSAAACAQRALCMNSPSP